jgi:uncharacterized protein (TIRG00374 family)
MAASMSDDATAHAPAGSLSNWKRNLVGLGISCACLGFIAWRIDLAAVRAAIAQFQWPYLLLGVLSLAFGYAMRVVRWSVMLKAAGAQVTPAGCAAPFLGSIALNNILPMRLGDVVRALVFPSALGIGKTMATGSLIMERLVDLMTLLACLVAGLALSSIAQLPEWMSGIAVGLAICGGIVLVLLFLLSGRLAALCEGFAARSAANGKAARNRVLDTLAGLLKSFDAMSRVRVLVSLFVLSMLVWAGEAGLFWSLLLGFGLDASPATAVVVMAIATLSTLVPSSPGYVGPFHLAAYAAIAMLGGSAAQAAGFAVLSHLGVWLPTTLAGAVAILMNPQLFSKARASAAAKP